MAESIQTAWAIERYINSQLHYWNPRFPGGFVPKHDEAIRFAREEDASVILAHLCNGIGRAANHAWVAAKSDTPS